MSAAFQLSIAWLLVLQSAGKLPDDGAPVSLADDPYALDRSRMCGAACVAFLERYFGGSTSYLDVAQRCGLGPRGTTLADLNRASQGFGWHTLGFRSDATTLRSLPCPAIVHLDSTTGIGRGEHFLVVLAWDEQSRSYRVFDPPGQVHWISSKVLEPRFSGHGLLVSVEEIPPQDAWVPTNRMVMVDWTLISVGSALVLAAVTLALLTARSRRTAAALSSIVLLAASSCHRSDSPETPTTWVHDAGTVLEGTTIAHTFTINNPTDHEIQVERIDRSCSCEVVAFDSGRKLPAHSTTDVRVEVPARSGAGTLRETITLHTNAREPNLAEIVVEVRAVITEVLKPVPSVLHFGSVAPGEHATKRLRVTSEWKDVADRLVAVHCDFPYAKVEPAGHRPGLLEFDVALDPSTPVGSIWGAVSLEFSDKEFSSLRVPLAGQKSGPLRAVPPRLVLGKSPASISTTTFRHRITAEDGAPVHIKNVLAPEGMVAEWSPKNAVTEPIEVVLSIEDDENVPRSGAAVRIVTDRLEQPEIVIPIFWSAR